MHPRGRGLFSGPQAALILAAALWPALVAALSQGWSPGIAAPDDLSVVGYIVRNPGGPWPDWRFAGGSVTLTLFMALGRWLPRQALWLQALPSATVGLEALLLAQLGARLAGPRTGVAAALVNATAAFSALRARTLLAFSLLPMELLAVLWALPLAQRRQAALAWGFAAAALLMDYEAWACALPGLAWLAWRQRSQRRWLLAGALLGLALVAVLSAPTWAVYAERRAALGTFKGAGLLGRAFSAPWAYFSGGLGGPHELGPWPAFPLWALPFTLLGLTAWGRDRAGLWLLLLVGLVPLAVGDSLVEARRASVAWPILCLAAGGGWSAWSGRRPRWAAPALGLLLLLAGAEAWGLRQGLALRDQATYGLSRRAAAAGLALQAAEPGPKELWLDLSGADHDWERWWLPSSPGGAVWALVPAAYDSHALRAGALAVIEVHSPGAAPVLWVKPGPALAERLGRIEAEGRALYQGLDRVDLRGLEDRALRGLEQVRDPWVRSLRLEAAIDAGLQLGGPAPRALDVLERSPLASGNASLMAAAWLGPRDPGRALRLARQATALNPRRAKAWALQAQLSATQGLPDEARTCAGRARTAEDW